MLTGPFLTDIDERAKVLARAEELEEALLPGKDAPLDAFRVPTRAGARVRSRGVGGDGGGPGVRSGNAEGRR